MLFTMGIKQQLSAQVFTGLNIVKLTDNITAMIDGVSIRNDVSFAAASTAVLSVR